MLTNPVPLNVPCLASCDLLRVSQEHRLDWHKREQEKQHMEHLRKPGLANANREIEGETVGLCPAVTVLDLFLHLSIGHPTYPFPPS